MKTWIGYDSDAASYWTCKGTHTRRPTHGIKMTEKFMWNLSVVFDKFEVKNQLFNFKSRNIP